ncbi:MAG: hypothetical protein IPL59_19170 [Candidatus Competibacteraceae bacterium]|nr:hypothetical protein [Candidatus Competibacteraceae bacterium]MBK8754477.1 hypothetical protein [Candidatus Competibacteraceae bacterium]
MLRLGIGALTHANWHSNYHSFENGYWPELSVLQAAHAAEILIKARIAEEHPLLIFEQLPRSKGNTTELELQHFFEHGRTVQYSDLPNLLWATTGIRLKNVNVFLNFGKLRNKIQHFLPPSNCDYSQETIEFIFKVIDPFIYECWKLFAVDYNEDYEPYIYFVQGLVSRGIHFLVSPSLVNDLSVTNLDWPKNQPEYQQEMERRFSEAKKLI